MLYLCTIMTMKKTIYLAIGILCAGAACSKLGAAPFPEEDKNKPSVKAGQLYNMSFDNWSKDRKGYDVCYGADASEAQKRVWGSANATTASYGVPTVVPEDNFVAVSGPGKRALCLKTQAVKVLWIKKLAAGSIFNGYTGSLDLKAMTAHIFWGIPFSQRPATLEGYACYKPGAIDFTDDSHAALRGKTDSGAIMVVLADWDTPYEVCPPSLSLDEENDPGIIGFGKLTFTQKMGDYQPFSIEIKYRNNRTPKYVAIVASASALGDYFTGSTGSVLYLDELEFTY